MSLHSLLRRLFGGVVPVPKAFCAPSAPSWCFFAHFCEIISFSTPPHAPSMLPTHHPRSPRLMRPGARAVRAFRRRHTVVARRCTRRCSVAPAQRAATHNRSRACPQPPRVAPCASSRNPRGARPESRGLQHCLCHVIHATSSMADDVPSWRTTDDLATTRRCAATRVHGSAILRAPAS